jgi:glycine cleavage system H protein
VARVHQARVAEFDLRFSADHLWVRVDGDRAQVGVSDFGQAQLGKLIAVELCAVGEHLEHGEAFGEVESVRTVQELLAPVTGTVTAVNGDLEDQAALVNEDPYHDGWLIELEIEDDAELEALMAADEYEESVSAAR